MSRSYARASASRWDISTKDSPSRRVTVTGLSSASAKTSAECLLKSEDRLMAEGRPAASVMPHRIRNLFGSHE